MEALVGLGRGAEARVLAHRPRAGPVHLAVDAPGVRRGAGVAERRSGVELGRFEVGGRVLRLDLDARVGAAGGVVGHRAMVPASLVRAPSPDAARSGWGDATTPRSRSSGCAPPRRVRQQRLDAGGRHHHHDDDARCTDGATGGSPSRCQLVAADLPGFQDDRRASTVGGRRTSRELARHRRSASTSSRACRRRTRSSPDGRGGFQARHHQGERRASTIFATPPRPRRRSSSSSATRRSSTACRPVHEGAAVYGDGATVDGVGEPDRGRGPRRRPRTASGSPRPGTSTTADARRCCRTSIGVARRTRVGVRRSTSRGGTAADSRRGGEQRCCRSWSSTACTTPRAERDGRRRRRSPTRGST